MKRFDTTAFDEAFAALRREKKGPPAPAQSPPARPRGAGPMTFGYVRVSTDRQASEGQSLDAQRAALQGYATQKGLGEAQVFVEGGVSAKVPFADRTAGRDLIGRLRPGDHLLMTKLDRGFRNLVDFLSWFDAWQVQGVSLHVLDFAGLTIDPRSATGRLFVHLMAAVAQWEREANGERVRAALAEKRAKGLLVGGKPPRGFMAARDARGRRIAVPDPYARGLMRQMLAWNEAGQSEMRILAHLQEHDIKPPGAYARGWSSWLVHESIRDERRLQAAERSAAEEAAN